MRTIMLCAFSLLILGTTAIHSQEAKEAVTFTPTTSIPEGDYVTVYLDLTSDSKDAPKRTYSPSRWRRCLRYDYSSPARTQELRRLVTAI